MSDTASQVQEKNDFDATTIIKDVSPAQRLSALLSADMAQVDAEIIARMQSDVPLIPKLAGYLISSGGKRIRPLLTLAATRLFDSETQRPYPLAAAVEFIHTATLLHDDVVDGSEERRGRAPANLVFGNQASVLVGDFLFSRAFQQMVGDGSLDVLRILSTASAVIAEGEVLQLSAQGNVDLTMDEYFKVIAAKTAALFEAACEIGPVITGQDAAVVDAIRRYGYHLGMAFQIADDVLDYNADRKKLGKAIGDDFREGKLTAPVILALQNATSAEKTFWKKTMQSLKQEKGDLERALDILNAHDSLNAGLAIAKDFANKAVNDLDVCPQSELKTLMQELALYTVYRDA
jgi:octaprenyl-diphosphate synthase|tara:strand:+ start:240093 stop:241136 length:1044 start_codon:yes stop_codon:yes gene_type:complete